MTTQNTNAFIEQVAVKIISFARSHAMTAGSALREEALASALHVSRTPIRRALGFLAEHKLVAKEQNRGIFLLVDAKGIDVGSLPIRSDPLEDFYLLIAEDCLEGKLPEAFSESELMRRYDAPRGQILKVLTRLASEGMIERKPGQGWKIESFLHDTEAHIQSYRFRMAIEPAAIMEPGFRIDKKAFAEARATQIAMLEGEIFTLPASQLFENGSHFHEMLVQCSGNRFFIEAIQKQNRLRRFMEYKAAADRLRLIRQCSEHLELLDLIEGGEREQAANYLRTHLNVVSKIKTAAALGKPDESVHAANLLHL